TSSLRVRMLDQSDFGKQLKRLCTERGLSQAALAGDFLSTGYLSRLESGARPPTPRVVAVLAERLGVPASAFDGDEAAGSRLARLVAVAVSAGAAVAGPAPADDAGVDAIDFGDLSG